MGPFAGRLVEAGANRMPQFEFASAVGVLKACDPITKTTSSPTFVSNCSWSPTAWAGQERGEVASSMAVEIIPQIVAHAPRRQRYPGGSTALRDAQDQPGDRRVRHDATRRPTHGHDRRRGADAGRPGLRANLGDSRVYLIRGYDVHQLTTDHSVAQALVATGALTPEEARFSPYQHVLHKFLGCTDLNSATEVHPFVPKAGDRLLLATDGMTNHINDDDLRARPKQFPDPQDWVNHLVDKAPGPRRRATTSPASPSPSRKLLAATRSGARRGRVLRSAAHRG